jgi:Chitobiase/beta-hexosaminidase C-terminal domain
MSRSRAINSIARIILPAALFLFTLSSHAQDAGAAAAQATQQANQAAAQAAQQANDQMMRDAQQANQQAMQNAQQAAMNSPATPQPHGYGRADKPKFYPSSGKFTGATSVTIKDSAPKASIFYTLDGTEPTTSSAPYTGPVLVGSTAKLKAIARSPIYTPSKVATATYVIK